MKALMPVPNRIAHWGLVRTIGWGLLLGTVAAWGTELFRMIFFANTHTVLPGRIYRSAQMTPEELEKFAQTNQIRTVINLRGRPVADWYVEESKATQRLGISLEDIALSANRLPAPNEVRRLIEVLDRCDYPVLIHCKQGSDRTGLASAISLLLYSNADYQTARRQCSPRYGHVGMFNTTKAMDKFFALYEDWLAMRGQEHQPALFREWATSVYVPGNAVAELRLVNAPATLPYGKPIKLVVQATNKGIEPWHFKAGSGVGVHARYTFTGPDGLEIASGRTNFHVETVLPGHSTHIPIALPAINKPGLYCLIVDLSERNVDFIQYGSEPLFYDWNCRTTPPDARP